MMRWKMTPDTRLRLLLFDQRLKFWMGLIPLVLFLFLCVRAPVRNLLTGKVAPQDQIAGEWVGLMHITGNNVRTIGTDSRSHRTAAVKFTLSSSDDFMDWYSGSGEMFVLGETQARRIRLRLHRDPDGQVKLLTLDTPSLPDHFYGSLKSGVMTWKSGQEGYGFSAEIKKGTDTTYSELVRGAP